MKKGLLIAFIILSLSNITYADEWRRVMPSQEEQALEQRQEVQELREKQMKEESEARKEAYKNLIDLEKKKIRSDREKQNLEFRVQQLENDLRHEKQDNWHN